MLNCECLKDLYGLGGRDDTLWLGNNDYEIKLKSPDRICCESNGHSYEARVNQNDIEILLFQRRISIVLVDVFCI